MTAHAETLPSPREIARRIPVFPALKQRRNHKSNIWFFDSPKNNRRFVITGDVAFMHFVLLEGDTTVERYDPSPEPVYASIDGEVRKTELDAHIYFKDGSVQWCEFKRHGDAGPSRKGRSRPQLSAQAQAAAAAGVPYCVRSDLDLQGKEILFDNWLTLCASLTRCRNQPLYKENDIFAQRLRLHREIRFGTLLEVPGIDPAYMLAVTASSLQRGIVETDLERSLFGLDSLLAWRKS